MNHERLDEETLAAFLDGTLPSSERASVLKALANNAEVYAKFLDAASVAAAVNTETAAATLPAKSPRGWRRSIMIAAPVLAAAGIAAVMFATRRPGVDTIALMQGAQLASATGTGSLDASLGGAWDQPPWPVVRGGEGLTATLGTAARIGARVAQLEFAASAADTAAWQRVALTLADLITSSIEGGGPVAQQLRGATMPTVGARATLAQQLRDLSGAPSAFDAGAWLETARLAAASGRMEYFRPDGDARASLPHVRRAIERDYPTWSAIISQLQALEHDAADTSGALIRQRIDSAMAALPR